MKKRMFVLCVAIVTLMFAAGCQTAQIALPNGNVKKDFQKIEAKGANAFAFLSGKFTLGQSAVEWTRGAMSSSGGGSVTLLGMKATEDTVKKQDFRIKTSGADIDSLSGKFHAEAVMNIDTDKKSKTVTVTSKEIKKNTLKGTITSQDYTYEMELQQSDKLEKIMKGSIKGKAFSFTIESTRRLEGAAFETYDIVGYYIFDNSKLIAAVESVNGGTLYVANGIGKDKLSVIMNVAAALIKYQDPSK